MHESRSRGEIRLLLCALALLAHVGPAAAAVREAWIVNGVARNIVVVDAELETVTNTIALDQSAGAPEPRALAFSTQEGLGGAFAFVGQGGVLHVVDVGVGGIATSFDLSVELGLTTEVIDLAAAQAREFGPAPATVKSYLYAAADVAVGGVVEPYYIVLDQAVLVGAIPGSPVAEFGPLGPLALPAADRGRAAGVAVVGAPKGDAWQRVWYTTRSFPLADVIRSIPVTRGSQAGNGWGVGTAGETILDPGLIAPDFFSVATPHDGEFPLLPTGPDGRLINLDTGFECALGADLRDLKIAGPGLGGYQIMALDGGAETLLRVDPGACGATPHDTGAGPVALAIDAIGEHGKVFVANRDADSVSILRLDQTIVEVPLGPAPPKAGCVLCPVEVELRRCCDGCTAKDLVLAGAGADDLLSWKNVGCVGCSIGVFCQCIDPEDADCSCYCGQEEALGVTPGPRFSHLPGGGGAAATTDTIQTESPWKQIGIVFDDDFTHTNAGPDIHYKVVPVP